MLPENAAIMMAKPMSMVFFLPIFPERKLATGKAIIAAACARMRGMIASFCLKPKIYSAYLTKFDVRALYVI